MAEPLSSSVQVFSYANLAIRGRLIKQVIQEPLEPAIALRPRGDPDKIVDLLDAAVVRLAQS